MLPIPRLSSQIGNPFKRRCYAFSRTRMKSRLSNLSISTYFLCIAMPVVAFLESGSPFKLLC